MTKAAKKKPETANGWGILVGGPLPYIAFFFSHRKEDAEKEVTQKYHKVVQVRMLLRKVKKGSKP